MKFFLKNIFFIIFFLLLSTSTVVAQQCCTIMGTSPVETYDCINNIPGYTSTRCCYTPVDPLTGIEKYYQSNCSEPNSCNVSQNNCTGANIPTDVQQQYDHIDPTSIPKTPTTPVPTLQILCQNGGINTSLGCIPIGSFSDLVGWLLLRGMGIAGGIGFLLVIAGGFQIITSAGNPKGVQAGQEKISSAVIGLLFIIFSIFLLELIGVKILALPGFGQ